MLNSLLLISGAIFFSCFGFALAAMLAADKIHFLEYRINQLEKEN